MKFLAPLFFWSFLSFIPLVAVYLLKVRPRRRDTTAWFLWRKVFHQKKSTSLFQRLRDVFSLLLMSLVFGAVCLALTRPELENDSRKDLLILIDNSASMQAGNGGSRRIALAREAAQNLVKGLDGTQRAAVASVADEVRFRSHLTDNPRELIDAIDGIEALDLPLSSRALESLRAGNSQEWMKGHRVILVSDGSTGSEPLPAGIELKKVGEPLENAGIVAADAQYMPGAGRRLAVYLQLTSSFKQATDCDLMIRREEDGTVGKIAKVKIAPGLNPSETWIVDDAEPGRWIAQLEIKDALERDNQAWLQAQQPKPVRVKVDAADPFFLKTAAEAFSGAAGFLQVVETDAQLTLARGKTPDAPLSLIFQPDGESPWWKKAGKPLEAVVPRVRVQGHAMLRHIDPAALQYAGAREITPPDHALVLVESDQGVPLIYLINADGRSAAVVNLDPAAGDFYFSPWFPALVYGAAQHLAGREEGLAATYPPGSVIPVPGVQEGELTTVTAPDGTVSELRTRRFGPLPQAGFYTLANRSGEWVAACSLLSSAESQLDNSGATENLEPVASGWPPYLLLTLGGIVLLVGESWLYHRRKVG